MCRKSARSARPRHGSPPPAAERGGAGARLPREGPGGPAVQAALRPPPGGLPLALRPPRHSGRGARKGPQPRVVSCSPPPPAPGAGPASGGGRRLPGRGPCRAGPGRMPRRGEAAAGTAHRKLLTAAGAGGGPPPPAAPGSRRPIGRGAARSLQVTPWVARGCAKHGRVTENDGRPRETPPWPALPRRHRPPPRCARLRPPRGGLSGGGGAGRAERRWARRNGGGGRGAAAGWQLPLPALPAHLDDRHRLRHGPPRRKERRGARARGWAAATNPAGQAGASLGSPLPPGRRPRRGAQAAGELQGFGAGVGASPSARGGAAFPNPLGEKRELNPLLWPGQLVRALNASVKDVQRKKQKGNTGIG